MKSNCLGLVPSSIIIFISIDKLITLIHILPICKLEIALIPLWWQWHIRVPYPDIRFHLCPRNDCIYTCWVHNWNLQDATKHKPKNMFIIYIKNYNCQISIFRPSYWIFLHSKTYRKSWSENVAWCARLKMHRGSIWSDRNHYLHNHSIALSLFYKGITWLTYLLNCMTYFIKSS